MKHFLLNVHYRCDRSGKWASSKNERGHMTQLYNFIIKLLLMTSIVSTVYAAEVYKTVDENGNPNY